jgi:hypothetical protein
MVPVLARATERTKWMVPVLARATERTKWYPF